MNVTVFNTNIFPDCITNIKKLPVKEKGSFKLSFDNIPDTKDIEVARNCRYIETNSELSKSIIDQISQNKIHNIQYSNLIAYPPNGGMDWHTNSNSPGIRIYVSWSENGNSGMMWYKDGELIMDQDNVGLNIRQFTVPCWHKIWSKCYRLSIGFKIISTIS